MWKWMWIWNVNQCIGLFHPFLLLDIVNEIQSSRAYLIIYIILTYYNGYYYLNTIIRFSFRYHWKTFQIHIHIHIFAFPSIHQLTHIGSNCAPDVPKTAWRRSWRYVATQKAIRRDAVGGTSPQRGGWEGDARDSWQGCTWFGTRMHGIQDNYCILPIFFVSLHCVRRKATLPFIKNGKWSINH